VRVLHMTEIEHYFLLPNAPISSVTTPRTEMNTLIYIFKRLRTYGLEPEGHIVKKAFEQLYRLCDQIFRYATQPQNHF